jgi:hypothetical protein
LRTTFDLPRWVIHTPSLLLTTEAAIAALNVLGVGLVVLALTRHGRPRASALLMLLAAAFMTKAISAATIVKSSGLFAWLTPGVAIGLLIGIAGLCMFARRRRRTQWIAAAVCFAAAIAATNIGPENPYQALPAHFLTGPRHFLNFSAIIRALSELWPFLAIAYAAYAASETPARQERL